MKFSRAVRIALAALVIAALPAAGQALDDGLARAAQAHAQRNYFRAFQLLHPLAQAGNAEAQLRLGLMYFRGQGVREDDAQAFTWLGRAAEAGLADAQFHFGNMHAFGFGVPATETDPDIAAARWYFAAARQGQAEAQHALGVLFLAGKGVVASREEAMRWFARAAASGHGESQRIMQGQGARP